MENFTYNDLKKQENRDEMKALGVSSLGTKSGNYGTFTEHFKVISVGRFSQVKSELEETASILGVSYDDLMLSMPKLKEALE